MRIELERVVLGSGTAVTRGSGAVVQDVHCAVWYENGFVWVQPRQPKGSALRMYHPAGCEMYPKPGQASVPAVPGAEPALAAVAGGKK